MCQRLCLLARLNLLCFCPAFCHFVTPALERCYINKINVLLCEVDYVTYVKTSLLSGFPHLSRYLKQGEESSRRRQKEEEGQEEKQGAKGPESHQKAQN